MTNILNYKYRDKKYWKRWFNLPMGPNKCKDIPASALEWIDWLPSTGNIDLEKT